ncbi:hemerythrin domain-containing protein [Wielerella bovis]|uniref:hemerythrin domain-containing protein n=1 Tax=Wielerella bovis TaxID=2917790 RepID=UPI002019A625|nr:hemerythrin domain-containing protein [Wielerella bovis]ULJ60605.1 hemerythrin domain-containing protein [Wielerella bovis]ULJ62818.1 hemerythrin domain-containing protein [Wielerella bovis]
MTDNIWQTAPLSTTIDHVLQRFHETHRQQAESILPLAEKVSRVHADKISADLLPLLQQMFAELESHMQKEERVLFPMIKNGMGSNAAMPVRMMMLEHDDHAAAIAQLLAITDNLTPPADACRSWNSLYAQLNEFVEDLQNHIKLENEILFPRALNE